MLGSRTILIVDEDGYAALDLSEAIAESNGHAAGPVRTLAEARSLLDSTDIGGAIVDLTLADATAVVTLLADRLVPIVAQVSGSVPPAVTRLDGKVSVLMRPVDPRTILQCLSVEIAKLDARFE